MKKIMLFYLLFSFSFTYAQEEAKIFENLVRLMEEKNFFVAKALFEKNKEALKQTEQFFIGSMLDNAFNRLEASDTKLKQINLSYLPDSLQIRYWQFKEDNAMKRFRYAEAKSAAETLLKDYRSSFDSTEIKNTQNNLKIWSALEKVPPQTIYKSSDTDIQMKKDKAGLENLPVMIYKDTIDFIFDTGANLSVVSESTARKMNMKIIPADIEVNSITGIKVKSDLAVCEKMTIGNMHFRNVVFLVFKDNSLAFPQIDYQINGIIGYPVIAAMEEISISRDGHLFVPESTVNSHTVSNLAMDGLMPLILIDGKHYDFDSGADHTILYKTYYDEHKEVIEKQYKPDTISFGGAGGRKNYPGYKIDVQFHIGDQVVSLKNVSLVTEKIKDETVYGNIGKDVMKYFDKMTLNFRDMFVKFE